jgi:hypothetical protein
MKSSLFSNASAGTRCRISVSFGDFLTLRNMLASDSIWSSKKSRRLLFHPMRNIRLARFGMISDNSYCCVLKVYRRIYVYLAHAPASFADCPNSRMENRNLLSSYVVLVGETELGRIFVISCAVATLISSLAVSNIPPICTCNQLLASKFNVKATDCGSRQ